MDEDLKYFINLLKSDFRTGLYYRRYIDAIEHLVQAYKQQADIIKNSVSKDKIIGAMREISNTNYNDYTEHQSGNDVKYRILFELNKKLLEGDE